MQSEEVAHVAVDFGGVRGAAFAKLPHLNEDANARAHFLDGAFGDHVHVEFASDLRPLRVALGILDDGACGADDEAWRRAEAIGDGIGERNGEELVVGRRHAELEWDDGDGLAAGGARSRSERRRWDREGFESGDDFGGACGTASGIFFETAEDQVVECSGQAGLERAGRRGSAGGDVVHDREHAGAGEGRLAGDGFVEDGAKREDV